MKKKHFLLLVVIGIAFLVLLPTNTSATCDGRTECTCKVTCSSSERNIGAKDCYQGGVVGGTVCCCPCAGQGESCTPDVTLCCAGLSCENNV